MKKHIFFLVGIFIFVFSSHCDSMDLLKSFWGGTFEKIRSGNTWSLSNALKKGNVDFSQRNERRETPFLYAVFMGELDVVRLFVSYHNSNNCNFFCDKKRGTGETALHLAAGKSWQSITSIYDQIIMKVLLNQHEIKGLINERDRDGNTPLHTAVKHGSVRVLSYLLEKGADPECQNNNNQTVLAYAYEVARTYPDILLGFLYFYARHGNKVKIREILNFCRQQGISFNINKEEYPFFSSHNRSWEKMKGSAFTQAIVCKHLNVVKYLCEVGGADFEQELGGYCDESSKFELIEDPAIRTYLANKCMEKLLADNHKLLKSRLQIQLSSCFFTRKLRRDLKYILAYSSTPFSDLVDPESGKHYLYEMLENYKALSVLAFAAQEKGSSVDIPDNDNKTPLWKAVENGYFKSIVVLLAAGADTTIRYNGETPLSYAKDNNLDKDIIELLSYEGDPKLIIRSCPCLYYSNDKKRYKKDEMENSLKGIVFSYKEKRDFHKEHDNKLYTIVGLEEQKDMLLGFIRGYAGGEMQMVKLSIIACEEDIAQELCQLCARKYNCYFHRISAWEFVHLNEKDLENIAGNHFLSRGFRTLYGVVVFLPKLDNFLRGATRDEIAKLKKNIEILLKNKICVILHFSSTVLLAQDLLSYFTPTIYIDLPNEGTRHEILRRLCGKLSQKVFCQEEDVEKVSHATYFFSREWLKRIIEKMKLFSNDELRSTHLFQGYNYVVSDIEDDESKSVSIGTMRVSRYCFDDGGNKLNSYEWRTLFKGQGSHLAEGIINYFLNGEVIFHKGLFIQGQPDFDICPEVEALAQESSCRIFEVPAWRINTIKDIQEVFNYAYRDAPCIVVFKKIDSLVHRKNSDSLCNELSSKITECMSKSKVFVIATGNELDVRLADSFESICGTLRERFLIFLQIIENHESRDRFQESLFNYDNIRLLVSKTCFIPYEHFGDCITDALADLLIRQVHNNIGFNDLFTKIVSIMNL